MRNRALKGPIHLDFVNRAISKVVVYCDVIVIKYLVVVIIIASIHVSFVH